ncbi:MAG: peptidoglycan-binding protein [Bauldia sp.]|uniref:peptidoglycan-binding domain-containing protein n=1 Tax=Bauldia sp. TaxID=2575872 RepID=UPI001D528235|nr:peptidoglycan-binding domain-containing protein [Bauldia sp.]MCB1495177.1 peptidoglycan-binding protein [Bauldia sp.]
MELVGDGVIGRLVDRVAENPAMSSGLVVMALTIAAVVSNAMFLQKSRHPEPLFMTRPAPVASARPAAASEPVMPDPRPRADLQAPAANPDDIAAAIDAPIPDPAPAPSLPQAVPESVVISELQQKLAERGLYDGKVDGISGSRTRAAIVAYQKAEGLAVTGEPSVDVLDHINTASVAPARPAPQPVAAKRPEAAPEIPAQPEPVPAVAAAGDAAPGDDAVASAIEIATRNRYVAVQRALNRMGYGPVAEDGLPSDEIANAVRRFELDNGLPITGKPDDQVVERLVSIGAMQAI